MELCKVCCSCGKSCEQVVGFFATSSAALCGECVMRAAKLLLCSQQVHSTKGGAQVSQATCIFCERTSDRVSKMAVFQDQCVCSECILTMADGLIMEKDEGMKFIYVPLTD